MEQAPIFFVGTVEPGWIDEYGHMNMARYVEACDGASYAFWGHANANRTLEARGGAEYAVVETHVNYLDELHLGEAFEVRTQILGADDKRFHLFHSLHHCHEGHVVATNEVMALGFHLGTRSVHAFEPAVRERLADLVREHDVLPAPRNAGRRIRMPTPK